MPQASLEQAYPGIAFRPRTRNWWARLTRVPAECAHLEFEHDWMATFVPDTLYLRGKPARREGQHQPGRPEVSLCRACLLSLLEPELAGHGGRVVAFEPPRENFSQYFYVAAADFDAAGLQPEVARAIRQRLETLSNPCVRCPRAAQWLWVTQQEVASLDEVNRIAEARGQRLCAAHGAGALCRSFQAVPEANLFYVNVPYGEAGAYVWI